MMRLIDTDEMAVNESEAYISAQTSGKISPVTQGRNSVVHRKIQQLIADTLAIDPEMLPIVQQLRAENKSLRLFFDDITSKPDCNTCGNKACVYKPEIGQTTRFNCPLWIEPKEEG